MKHPLTLSIKLMLAAALVLAAWQYALAYRAEQARLLDGALGGWRD